jgi:uncharacterized membrane protein YphA (DoxX/SURF4 family)
MLSPRIPISLDEKQMVFLRHFGRILFAIGVAAFGAQYLLYGHYLGGLPPVPPWAPGGAIGAYVVGVFLIVAAVAIAAQWNTRLLAALVGALFLFCVVFFHLQHFSDVLHKGTDRTRALEPLALAAAAFVLAGTSPDLRAKSSAIHRITEISVKSARFVFAFTLVIFGWQHFEYAAYLATLVPTWLPFHLAWIYFTGTGFIVAGACIALKILGRLAAATLGLMFFLWVVTLHAPRVYASFHNGDEWSSLFVALAMAGGSFFIASTLPNRS